MKLKRAQFFTMDAMVSLVIIIIAIMVVIPLVEYSKQDSSTSSDILKAIGSLKVGDFDNSYTKQLIINGQITNQEKTIIEQIGEFYISNITIAKALAEEVLDPISETENIGIWFGSSLLASKNITPFESSQNIFVERQTISGIGGGAGVSGFSSRAFLSSPMRTDYSYFGGYIGEGNITKEIIYQGNISSATIELAINNNFNISINGIDEGNFSASPDEFTPVSYSIPTSSFASGNNTIEILGENLHIAGGFIKITYESSVAYEQPVRYYFPGIAGIINLYDGFYVPGNLTGLNIYLHFNNSIETFLNIGSTEVFSDTSDGTPVIITNSTLNGLLNYENLSKETIPIRFGMEDVEYVSNGTSRDIDVFSITDISGSMQASCSGASPFWCCWFNDCSTESGCSSCGGTLENKIGDAKDANKLFIDMILNDTNNKVGLSAYSGEALDSNYHQLSNNNISLKAEVDTWTAGGGTCICCGVNKGVDGILADFNSSKFQSLVVMSDGDATVTCDAEQGTGDPGDDAVQAACDAYNNYGIKVYTIGFGEDANVQTLTEMAACADGSFYSAVDDLDSIYEKIAEEIIETAYYEQTIEVTGDFFSELFEDSYIEFEYSSPPSPIGLITKIEQPFSTQSTATFSLPDNSTLLDVAAISYSGPKWTSLVQVNNQTVYNLSEYEEDFLNLGDPYTVNIPVLLTSQENNLTLGTGLQINNITSGSINNTVIYTISKELSSYTSVSETAEGCNWTIQFEEYNLTTIIPANYSGGENCKYTSVEEYCDIYPNCEGATDATQIATYNLFKLIDFNLDGIVDVELTEDNLQISTSNLEGVPFLFSTEVQIRKWN